VNEQNTKVLIERFKFLMPPEDKNESLIPSRGIEVGDGWFDLIWEMCEIIEPLVDKNFYFTQIKEKFGGLRVYTTEAPTEVYEILDEYEDKSYNICEECGKDGKRKKSITGWISTLCDKCAMKLDF